MHVHHPRGGAVLRRGHLGATLLIFALFLVLVLLEEKMEQKPSHHMACACVSKPLGGGMNILFSQFISEPASLWRVLLGLHLNTSH